MVDGLAHYAEKVGNTQQILRAILSKSWIQHSRNQQMYGPLPTISKTSK